MAAERDRLRPPPGNDNPKRHSNPFTQMKTLHAKQISRQLKSLPQWSKRGKTIRRRFEFEAFPEAVGFVNRVAVRAEKSNHHPDIDIRWNKVTLALTTHDKGGLTGKDFSMARECDEVFSRFFAP